MHRVLPLIVLGLFAASTSWSGLVAPPAPLPFTDVITIGPPPICPGREIPFFIAGTLPGNCYQFRGLELRPSPRMGPMPEPPIARVTIAHNDCLEFPCNQVPIPWQASAMLPPLPSRDYHMIVEVAEVGWCDTTRTPDTLHTAIVPFQVAEGCSLPPPTTCYLHGWKHDTANPNCDAFVGRGIPARAVLTIMTETPLAGLQGRLELDPAALRIVGLRPVGAATGMQLAWNPLPNGASFVLFSIDDRVITGSCMPPALCPPRPEPVLAVLVEPRPGVPIPPLALLDALDLLAADTLGREVIACPSFAPIAPARICAGHRCDFNADGYLDVRDLVPMAACVMDPAQCPDSAATHFDCDDSLLTVNDVVCCGRLILHGRTPDTLATRPEPGLAVNVGPPAVTSGGLDLPIRLTGADRVGAARFKVSYPAARYAQVGVELLGDAGSWLEVSEAADGELILGLIAMAPAGQVPEQLELRVHFGLAPGQTASTDVQVVESEFAGPDGVLLAVTLPPTDVKSSVTRRLELSAAKPNPFAGETELVLSLVEPADIELAIFDLVGRRVATLHQGRLAAGDHPFRWDGRQADGTRPRDGVYFCRVLGAEASATRRLILIDGR